MQIGQTTFLIFTTQIMSNFEVCHTKANHLNCELIKKMTKNQLVACFVVIIIVMIG